VPSRYESAACLADIVEKIERIDEYLAELDREAFGADLLRRDAVWSPRPKRAIKTLRQTVLIKT
jgi:uncharacterized protein with HEPN domain